MEKLVYVLWKRGDLTVAAFAQEMLGPAAARLAELGARGVAVNLADDQAAAAARLRMTHLDPPMTGTVSIWMDSALGRAPLEDVLRGLTSRLAGYLALESVPIVNTQHPVAPGERTPGLYTVAFLEKPDFLDYDSWLEIWQGSHTQVAIETQSTFLYVQNVLVRPVTPQAPPWTAIVEEAFPAGAASDPMVFYDAGGSKEKLAENQRRMMASVQRFIDLSRLESHPFSAYVPKSFPPGPAGR